MKLSKICMSAILFFGNFFANAQKQNVDIDKLNWVTELNYINIQNPEDLVQIPNTKWIIASGMAPKSGLHLIDSHTKTAQRFIAPVAKSPLELYANSEPQPHADEMQIHGISLRQTGKGKYLLYAVNHNGFDQKITRETIEIFEVLVGKDIPTLTWLGNVRMPNDFAGNGVVSGADGSIYVTVMTHPENTLEEMFAGKTTGAIYRWSPKTQKFEKLKGSELSGNNGIELSKDEKFIFVAHTGKISKLTNTNPTEIVASVKIDYGGSDNLHWSGNQLITAGAMQENCTNGITFDCLKDFHITKINPKNLALKPIAKGRYTKDFSGASTVLVVGKTFYLGSFYRNKLAYFTLKK